MTFAPKIPSDIFTRVEKDEEEEETGKEEEEDGSEETA